MNTIFKVVGIVVLLVLGLGGLGVSLCGAAFSFVGVFSTSHEVLSLSLPSLVIGGGLAYLCFRGVKGLASSDDEAEAQESPEDRPE